MAKKQTGKPPRRQRWRCKKRRRARPPRSSPRRRAPRPTTRRCTARPATSPSLGPQPRSRKRSAGFRRRCRSRRASCSTSTVHAPGRGGALGAGDRRRRQQGDAGAVCARRHAGEDGGARRGARARADQDHRALSHQGEERHRAVGEADRRARRSRCRAPARRCRSCRASAARPPTSCSTWRSASRPWRSTRTSSGSATAPGWRPARTRWRWSSSCSNVIPEKYMMHAHHWLILHGRYICLARRPLCEKCVIADLCKWPGKTVAA